MNTLKTMQSVLQKLSIAGKVADFIFETALCRDENGKPCDRDLRAGISTKLPSVFPTLFANEVNALVELTPKRETWALTTLRTMAGHAVVNERMASDVRAAARYASTLVETEIAKRERAQATEAHAQQQQRVEQAAKDAAEQERQSAEEKRLTAALRALNVQEVRGAPSIDVLEKLLARHRAIALEWVAKAIQRVNSLCLTVGEPIMAPEEVDETANEIAIRARLNELFDLENSLKARKREQEERHARFRRSQHELAQLHDRARGKPNGSRQHAVQVPRTETKFETKLREIRTRAARAREQAAAE